jgi:hypothetical protein
MISLMTSRDVIDDVIDAVTSVPDLDRVIATNIDIDKMGDQEVVVLDCSLL